MKRIIKFLFYILFIYVLFNIFLTLTVPIKYEEEIDKTVEKTGINKALLLALIKQESNFKFDAVSNKGALGLTKLMPTTIDYVTEKFSVETKISDIFIPEKNIYLGAIYLKDLIERFKSEKLALIAYNAGPSNLKKWLDEGIINENLSVENIPFEETKKYVQNIEKLKKRYELLLKTPYRVPEKMQDYILKFKNQGFGSIKSIKKWVEDLI